MRAQLLLLSLCAALPVHAGPLRVIDGDTVDIGLEANVRLTLEGGRPFDTPETYRPSCAYEARLGRRASDRLLEILLDADQIEVALGSRTDTAGAATQATVFSIGCADLVLIPCQLSSADVIEAIKTKQLVESAAKMTRRDICTRAILTDYQPNTVIAGHVKAELSAGGLTTMHTTLNRLVAFKEMTFTGLVPTSGAAARQVEELISELSDLSAMPFLNMPIAS